MTSSGWQQDNQSNIEYFSRLVTTHGVDVKSLDWGSKASQYKRFSILSEVGDVTNHSVLDVGCGIGDLLAWFKGQDIVVDYHGLDITPKMIEVACQRFSAARFDVKDILDNKTNGFHQYDYVFASGIFTFRHHDANGFLRMMVRQMYSMASIAVAFNALSAWAEPQEPGEFYADPLQTVAFCRTLTPWVVLRHDYHAGDFSIYLYRTSPY